MDFDPVFYNFLMVNVGNWGRRTRAWKLQAILSMKNKLPEIIEHLEGRMPNFDDVLRYAEEKRVNSRDIWMEQGDDIDPDIMDKLEQIEKESHRYDIRETCASMGDTMRVIHGEDWYCAYSVQPDEILFHHLAYGAPRVEAERSQGMAEIRQVFENILRYSAQSKKPIKMECEMLHPLIEELSGNGLIKKTVGEDGSLYFRPTAEYKKVLKKDFVDRLGKTTSDMDISE